MKRSHGSTGLEGAPDIMLLTMAALMVAIVWLVSHAQEMTLPPIELPKAEAARLGTRGASAVIVTLRVGDAGVEVFVDDRRVQGGIGALRAALTQREPGELVLRADAASRWEDSLYVMNLSAELGLPLVVSGSP